MADFYSVMKDHAADKTIPTVSALLSDYAKSLATYAEKNPGAIPPGVLAGTRKAIAAEVFALTGDDPAKALDPALREALAKLFEAIAAVLRNLP